MELPVPNSLDAAAGAVVKSSHEITAAGGRRWIRRGGGCCRGEMGVYIEFYRFRLQVEGIYISMLDTPT